MRNEGLRYLHVGVRIRVIVWGYGWGLRIGLRLVLEIRITG